MFRIIFSLFIVLLFDSCGGSETTANTSDSDSIAADSNLLKIGDIIFEISNSSKEEFEKYPSTRFLRNNEIINITDTARVKRSKDSLILILNNDKPFYLVNDSSDDDDQYVVFEYVNNLKKINQWAISASFYEWWDCYLIDQNTGDTTVAMSHPIISPNGKMFICGDNDLHAAMDENGFEIYEMRNNHPFLLGKIDLETWGPLEIKWITNKEILVKRVTATYPDEKVVDVEDFIKLTMK